MSKALSAFREAAGVHKSDLPNQIMRQDIDRHVRIGLMRLVGEADKPSGEKALERMAELREQNAEIYRRIGEVGNNDRL